MARAPALQAGGRGFESHLLHQIVAIPTAVSTVMTAIPDAVDAFAGDPESLPKLAAILAEADVKRESDLAPLKSIVADRPA